MPHYPTNCNLKEEVEAKRFRQELYCRLHVFPVEVLPLRDRLEDISLLASRFVERAANRLNLLVPSLTQANIHQLQGYDWPGNVRELQNVLERAVITARSSKLSFDLPKGNRGNGKRGKLDIHQKLGAEAEILTEEYIKQREQGNIIKTLNRYG